MKKLLIIQLVGLFLFACGGGDDVDTPYYNPVEGEWNIYDEDGQLLHTRVYTSEFFAYFSVLNGNIQQSIIPLRYEVQGNQLIFDRYTQTYLIQKDTLWITNSHGDQVTKYIKKKETINF
jgi:hypothetical protein